MRKPFNMHRFLLKFLVLVLLFPATPLFGQDFQTAAQSRLLAYAQIPTEQMSISYFGHQTQSTDQMIVNSTDKSPDLDIKSETFSNAGVLPKNELVRFGEKIKELTQHALRYVFFDNRNDQSLTSDFQMKSSILQKNYQPDDLDINFAFNLGMDEESKNIGLNAVKLSSYGYSTYVDAIYEYKTNNVDLIFSNIRINELLMNGMKLEFQVTPKKAGGALLFTMDF